MYNEVIMMYIDMFYVQNKDVVYVYRSTLHHVISSYTLQRSMIFIQNTEVKSA